MCMDMCAGGMCMDMGGGGTPQLVVALVPYPDAGLGMRVGQRRALDSEDMQGETVKTRWVGESEHVDWADAGEGTRLADAAPAGSAPPPEPTRSMRRKAEPDSELRLRGTNEDLGLPPADEARLRLWGQTTLFVADTSSHAPGDVLRLSLSNPLEVELAVSSWRSEVAPTPLSWPPPLPGVGHLGGSSPATEDEARRRCTLTLPTDK
mmetsp:Transcript_19057/g.36709  ORF Transcript_19057/g.36709 Transcript_19057/m.36709 type:complete len:207 (-) Transcript_19057:854-1474(-)